MKKQICGIKLTHEVEESKNQGGQEEAVLIN